MPFISKFQNIWGKTDRIQWNGKGDPSMCPTSSKKITREHNEQLHASEILTT